MTTDFLVPRKAFILGAGRGQRMQPLTDVKPKPMMEINGRSLIYRTLDHLCFAGVQDVAINLHHLADVLRRHLSDYRPPSVCERPRLHFSEEPVLLDTGGGVKHALQHFGDEPFYVIAGDGLWSDGTEDSALLRLARAWDPKVMDILILLQRVQGMRLTPGVGDYDFLQHGQVVRHKEKAGDFMWTNIRINRPGIFADTPDGPFSFLDILDRTEREGRLYGLVHDGLWHHISAPDDLERADRFYTERDL
jgi:MurNAc alpha-1-phosphate uridylyltransferase